MIVDAKFRSVVPHPWPKFRHGFPAGKLAEIIGIIGSHHVFVLIDYCCLDYTRAV